MTSLPSAAVSRFAWIVVAATAAARFGLLAYAATLGDQVFLQPDSATYIAPAEALLACGRFAVSPSECDVAEVLRTPAYPLLIAACRVLFGPSLLPLLAFQILLAAWTQLLTWRLADRLAGPRAGNIAVVLSALQLNATHYAVQVLTETFFTALLTPSIWLLVRTLDAERAPMRLAAYAGLLLAAATFVRPTTFFLPWPMAVVLGALLLRRRVAPRLALATALAFATCAMLPLHAWQLRNRVAAGYGGFSSISAASLLLYRAAGVEAMAQGISFAEAQGRIKSRVAPYDPRNPAASVAEFRAHAADILSAHPTLVVKMTAIGAARMILGSSAVGIVEQFRLPHAGSPLIDLREMGVSEFARKWIVGHPWQTLWRGAALAALCILYPLVLVALAKSPRGARGATALCLFVVVYLVAVSAGPEAYARFRVPAVPMLCAIAGAGAALLRRPR